MTQEIQDALFNIDEVTELRHAIYNDEDDDYDIGADVGANFMDPRVVNLRHGPADRSYVGEEI